MNDGRPLYFVDPHVHWWDRSNPWFVTATQEQADAFAMGDVSGMDRDYLPADYHQDASDSGVDVPTIVWVTANLGPDGAAPEVAWVGSLPQGEPALGGIVGGVDPSLPTGELAGTLLEQNRSGMLRGVRWLGGLDYGSSAAGEFMRVLAHNGCLYDLVVHQEEMAAAASLAARHADVPFVLEHCGWPQQPGDPDYVDAWRRGISALAAVETVSCKISGLAMAVHSFDRAAQQPFIEHCLEAFGVDRCMFASNFPVDALYGSYTEMNNLYLDLSEPLGSSAQSKLFYANAERIYGLPSQPVT